MGKYDPPVYFGPERFNAEKANNLREAEVEALIEQNLHLKALAEAAEKSSRASDKSAKRSFICAVLSVIVSIMMLVTTVVGLCISPKGTDEPANQNNQIYSLNYECRDK